MSEKEKYAVLPSMNSHDMIDMKILTEYSYFLKKDNVT